MFTIEHRKDESNEWSKVSSASGEDMAKRAAFYYALYRHGQVRIIDAAGKTIDILK